MLPCFAPVLSTKSQQASNITARPAGYEGHTSALKAATSLTHVVWAEEDLPELHYVWVAQCAVVQDFTLHIALVQGEERRQEERRAGSGSGKASGQHTDG